MRKCVPLLLEKNIAAHLKRCKSLVNHLKHAHSGRIIFFSDEKNFCVDPVRNSRDDQCIRFKGSEVNEDVPTAAKFITKRKHPASLMLLGAVTSTGKVSPPIWLPTRFCLFASNYQKVLRKTLIPWIKEVSEKHNKDFIFQQDEAPAHTARSTQACLREAGVDIWQKKMWPPLSSDLSPLDFSIWGHIESMACSKRHSSLTALKRSVNRARRKMNEDFVIKVCSKFRPGLEACIEAKGGLIEWIILPL